MNTTGYTGSDEHDRVHRVQRTVLPLVHPVEDLVGDRRDRGLRDLGAVHIGQVRGDITVRHPAGGQGQHDVFDAPEPAPALLHDHRFERAGAVPGYIDRDRVALGLDGLRTGAVTGVAVGVAAFVLLVSEMVGQFPVEGRFDDDLGQLGQQPVLTIDRKALRAGLANELRDEGPVDTGGVGGRRCHGFLGVLDRVVIGQGCVCSHCVAP